MIIRSDLQNFLTHYPRVATHPKITVALNRVTSLGEAQRLIHALFWQSHQNMDLLWIYGEFLYLSGYDPHPEHNVGSLIIRTDNETTRVVKHLAFEQWLEYHPQGFPGVVWLHPATSQEQQTIRQVWQVSVYHLYENAVTHDISNRLCFYDLETSSWDHRWCRWYCEHAPYTIDYSTSMIAEYPDGRLQVSKNVTHEWGQENLLTRPCPVLPHAPAHITEQMHPRQESEK